MRRRPTVALLAVALVVLAGCSAPVADAPGPATDAGPATTATTSGPGTTTDAPDDGTGTTTTTTPDDGTDDGSDPDDRSDDNESRAIVRTVDFETEYNATLVLRRVEALRGLAATGPIFVHEIDPANRTNVSPRDFPDRYGKIGRVGAKLLQLYTTERVTPSVRSSPGFTLRRGDEVHVYVLNATAMERQYGWSQRVVLAHELVHALQYQHGLFEREDLTGTGTTDGRLALRASIEGDAVYVTERYVRRYHPSATVSPAFYNRTPKATWSLWIGNAAYLQGYRHYRRTAAGPAARTEFIAAIQNTTGALFPGWPGELGPAPTPFENESLTIIRRDRVGPLAIRYALRANGVGFGAANDAVIGWRNGSVYYYSASDGLPVAWVTAWANGSEAAEFVATWRALLERKGATQRDGVLVVPGTDTTPTARYVLRREGDTVYVFYAADAAPLRRLAAGWANRTAANATSAGALATDAVEVGGHTPPDHPYSVGRGPGVTVRGLAPVGAAVRAPVRF